jgi:hypothetical protein
VTVLVSYDHETGVANRWVKETHTKLTRTHTAEVLPPEEWTEAAVPLDMLLWVFRRAPDDQHRIGVMAYSAAGLLSE